MLELNHDTYIYGLWHGESDTELPCLGVTLLLFRVGQQWKLQHVMACIVDNKAAWEGSEDIKKQELYTLGEDLTQALAKVQTYLSRTAMLIPKVHFMPVEGSAEEFAKKARECPWMRVGNFRKAKKPENN